ncbi:UBL4A isoform 5 [Pongo abelii]|uniref:UBL4A isoform 5 n=1 Tax=Pongo abelii TaxID=9601 RepID=A0A2J8RM29_PONAB|nr:UBL4A isoform 5 [Pongo abelii]
MQLTVKALQGRECSLQVPEDELVSTLKQLVSEKLNVPVRQQRLLFKGKALAAGCRGALLPPPEAASRPGPPPRRRRRRNPSICLWQMGNDSRIIASGPTPSST